MTPTHAEDIAERERPRDESDTDMPAFIVAREGSELARALRCKGWVARVGWRTMRDDGTHVWFMRFEEPAEQA
jgi:hypothetical protein